MRDDQYSRTTYDNALAIGLSALKSAQNSYGDNQRAFIDLAVAAARLAQAAK